MTTLECPPRPVDLKAEPENVLQTQTDFELSLDLSYPPQWLADLSPVELKNFAADSEWKRV